MNGAYIEHWMKHWMEHISSIYEALDGALDERLAKAYMKHRMKHWTEDLQCGVIMIWVRYFGNFHSMRWSCPCRVVSV